jgi:RNA polymerase sporulation-specific sigma factor
MQNSPEAVKNSLNLTENELLTEAEFLELIQLSKAGSTSAKEMIIQHNLRLVMSIAQRFSNRGEVDDLFQIGCLGLMRAVERFDPAYGVKFSTYAVPLIIGEIKQNLRDSGPLKIGRSIKENHSRIEQTCKSMIAELGREPTLAELVAATGLSREDITCALEAGQPVTSLQEIISDNEGEGFTKEQLIGVEGEHHVWLEHYALQEVVSKLPEKLKLLIELRFFQEKTQHEVAGVFGISQVQVCRLEKSALNQLRSYFNVEY